MRVVAFIHSDDLGGFGISFPDFPGCISDGATVEDALNRGEAALGFHVEGMRDQGLALPELRGVDAILADDSLADWREAAQITVTLEPTPPPTPNSSTTSPSAIAPSSASRKSSSTEFD